MRTILLVAYLSSALATTMAAAPAQDPAIFRSGTRLVEVDVTVRNKNGPVTGLTRDDFTLYDCKPWQRDLTHPMNPCKGKRQPVEVFREVNDATSQTSGVVSNGATNTGEPIASATVVLLDQLNTPNELKSYQRFRVAEFLKSAGDKNRFAVYALGKDLHLLMDFTSDPEKLAQALAHLDSGEQFTFATDPAGDGFAIQEAIAQGDIKCRITLEAVKTIAQHMDGMQGRKNLVWIGQQAVPECLSQPPRLHFLLGQANIAVYPVMVRSLLGPTNVLGATSIANGRRLPPPPGGPAMSAQLNNRLLGESLGGTGFGDASDILAAVLAAEEDSKSYYVLGFYPADDDLDGQTHQLTLQVSRKIAARPGFTLRYRQIYLATKTGAPEEDKPFITDLFQSPLDSAAIGVTGTVTPGRVAITVNLANVQFQRQDDRWIGSLQTALRLESKENGVLLTTAPILQPVPLSLTDTELQAMRAYGLTIVLPLPHGAKPGTAHIVVQDVANGAAGSVRVAIP